MFSGTVPVWGVRLKSVGCSTAPQTPSFNQFYEAVFASIGAALPPCDSVGHAVLTPKLPHRRTLREKWERAERLNGGLGQ